MKLTKEMVEHLLAQNNQAMIKFDPENLISKEFKMSPSQRVINIKNKLKDPVIERLVETIQYHVEQNEKRTKRVSPEFGSMSPSL